MRHTKVKNISVSHHGKREKIKIIKTQKLSEHRNNNRNANSLIYLKRVTRAQIFFSLIGGEG